MNKVRTAFVKDFKLAFPDLVGATEYENAAFTIPVDCALWASFKYQELDRDFQDTQEDEVTGYIQIDFNVPRDTGEAVLLTNLEAASQRYVSGFSVTEDGITAGTRKSSISPARVVGTWYRKSITIYFNTRIFR